MLPLLIILRGAVAAAVSCLCALPLCVCSSVVSIVSDQGYCHSAALYLSTVSQMCPIEGSLYYSNAKRNIILSLELHLLRPTTYHSCTIPSLQRCLRLSPLQLDSVHSYTPNNPVQPAEPQANWSSEKAARRSVKYDSYNPE